MKNGDLMFVRLIVLVGLAAALTCGALSASAASYALLVGVSDYEESTGIADLRGPANDVALLRDTLAKRGKFKTIILADGIDGSARPTRAAILDAFARLATQAGPGDFVFVHMSGHGTQQPDDDGDESDGLDEVFLPADTQRAAADSREIPNAIRDEELGSAVATLRAKGADVWFVLDSCHSGSGLRAATQDVATRYVDPATLGVDATATALDPAKTATLEGPGDEDLPGKYLAFYAAQSSELAREIQIDPNAASDNGWYGLFTSRLAARLSQDGAVSYRQLFQAVMSDMNGSDIPGGARLQTPLWEGNLIDATVLGGQETIGIRQFAVDKGQVDAGLLHGLQPGTVLGLVDDATAGPQETSGFAQVVSASARSASISPVAQTCVPDPQAMCPELDVLPATARFARVVARPIDLTLRLAVPVEVQTGVPVPANSPLRTALEEATERVNGSGTARIELVQTDPDISVGVFDGALWFGPRVTAGDSPVGLAWRQGEDALDGLLLRIFAAERVARMLQSVNTGGSILFGNPVDITIKHRDTNMQSRPRSVGSRNDLVQECQRALMSADVKDLARVETVNQCDQLFFVAKGVVQGPARDVNRIYIDSQYCIETAYVRVEGTAVEAQLGQPMTVCSDCPEGDGISQKAGHERLFVITTEARDNAESLDLRGLLENCQAPDVGGATRSGASGRPAAAFLESIGTRTGMRGNFDGMGISSLWVERFDWQVLPRRQALIHEGIQPE
ncbi:Caspase domain protein (plasmid) [Sulfitobacter sp. THAF37]|nr:Caspase domain protein [Sulfitobacter sp. THAF37]